MKLQTLELKGLSTCGSTSKALFLAPQFLTQTWCLTRTSTSSEHTALNKLKKTFILRQLVLNELHPPSQSRSGLRYSTAVFYIAVPGYMFVVIVAYISLHLLTLLHNIY